MLRYVFLLLLIGCSLEPSADPEPVDAGCVATLPPWAVDDAGTPRSACDELYVHHCDLACGPLASHSEFVLSCARHYDEPFATCTLAADTCDEMRDCQ